jgi:hypothetical protein
MPDRRYRLLSKGLPGKVGISVGDLENGDGVFWNPDTGQWETERRMNWVHPYTPGDLRYEDDVVRDGGWLMIANKETTSPAAPQNVGSPFYPYDGTLSNTSENAAQLTFGSRYSIDSTGYIQGYRIYTHPGQRYVVYTVTDPLGEKRVNQVVDFEATTTGWRDVTTSPILVGALTLDLVVSVTGANPVPTETTLSYDYTQPQNDTAPLPGGATQSGKTTGVINFNYVDQATNDNETYLKTLDTGDQITGSGVSWTIQEATYFADYVAFEVTPAVQGLNTGVMDFVFGTVPDIPVLYDQDVDYWLTSPYNVKGLYGVNIPYDEIVPDDTARGADILLQAASFSDDWDIMSYSSGSAAGGSSGAPGEDGTIVQSARFNGSADVVWSGETGWSGRDDGVGLYTVFFPTAASVASNQAIQATLNTTGTSAAGIVWVDNITVDSCRVRLANSGGVAFDNGFAVHRIVG